MEKALPHDAAAEAAVNGACLLDRDCIIALAPSLSAAHFYSEQQAQIYAAILSCYQQRVPPEIVNVAAELRKAGHLVEDPDADPARVITRTTLVELVNGAMTSVHAEYYAAIVIRQAQLRKLITAGQAMVARAYAGTEEPGALIAATERDLLSIAQPSKRRGLRPISEAVDDLYTRVTSGVNPGLSTGLRDFDEATGGLHPGRLYLLAGLPGHGKSALAGQMVYHIASAGHRCQVFSLEMTYDEWAARYISCAGSLDSRKIAENNLHETDMPQFYAAAEKVSALPIMIDDGTAPTVDEIRMTALQDAAINGAPAAIIIDPLLLVARPDPRKTDAAQIGAIEAAAKNLARDMGAAVLILHHLNAQGELYQGGGKQADVVMFIEQPQIIDRDQAAKDQKLGIAELRFQKNRGGRAGQTIGFKFFGETTSFKDLSRYVQPEGY